MLAIQPPSSRPSQPRCTPNLLPCRIHHDGPVNVSPRYWDPKPGADGTPDAYFRGRNLKGKEAVVPEGYRGVVVRECSGGINPGTGSQGREERRRVDGGSGEGEEEEEEEEAVQVLEEVAGFEEVVVWGHELVPEADDVFVKGMAEWIRFAEAMHTNGDDGSMRDRGEEKMKADNST